MPRRGQSVTAELPAGATAGFHVALVDSMTRAALANEGPGHQIATASTTAQERSGRSCLSYSNTSGQPVLIVQEHRAPAGATHGWESVAEGLRRFGSSFFVAQGSVTTTTTRSSGRSAGRSGVPSRAPRPRGRRAERHPLPRPQLPVSPMLAADELSPVTTQMFEVHLSGTATFPAFTSAGEKQGRSTYISMKLEFCSADSTTCEIGRRYYETTTAPPALKIKRPTSRPSLTRRQTPFLRGRFTPSRHSSWRDLRRWSTSRTTSTSCRSPSDGSRDEPARPPRGSATS